MFFQLLNTMKWHLVFKKKKFSTQIKKKVKKKQISMKGKKSFMHSNQSIWKL